MNENNTYIIDRDGIKKYECQSCKNHFYEEFFDLEQQKCFLHCDKNENSKWLIKNDNNKLIWDLKKIDLFWKLIQNDFDYMYDTSTHQGDDEIEWEYDFIHVIFPAFQEEQEYISFLDNLIDIANNFYVLGSYPQSDGSFDNINTIINQLKVSFIECTFLETGNFKKYHFKEPILFQKCIFLKEILLSKKFENTVEFDGCNFSQNNVNVKNLIFENKFSMKYCFNINKIDFFNSIFKDSFRFQNCYLIEKSIFDNTKFNKLADFYNTTFNYVNFNKTTFEDIVVFSHTTFRQNTNFQYTTFEKLAIFRDSNFEETLNLRDSIFKSDVNFLDIKANMANRETARIIKYQLQKIGNIIDSNKFHSLELSQQRKDIWDTNEFSLKLLRDGIVSFLHFISSNHSTNWVLTLFWIFVTGYLTGFGLEKYNAIPFDFLLDTIKYMSIIQIDENIKQNPIILFFNKAVLGYLYYQFLTAIRKDTRSS